MNCPECITEYTADDFVGTVHENDLSVEIICSSCGCECHIGTATQADFDRAIFRQGLKPAKKKQRITIMLDAGIVSYFKAKAGQRGYQTLINDTLRQAIAFDTPINHGFEQMLRKIIREEVLSAERA